MAAARNLILMVSQNYRFFPAPRVIAWMVHESALGKLYAVEIDFRRYSTVGQNGRGRHHLEEQPLLVDRSIHHFDLLRMILSREPRRIYCEAWNPEWTAFSGPSVAVASIDFEGAWSSAIAAAGSAPAPSLRGPASGGWSSRTARSDGRARQAATSRRTRRSSGRVTRKPEPSR